MPRKTYNGAFNSKERSMKKLLDAVGSIIKTNGYTGLRPSNIAKYAGVDKRLISLYFGTTENLIEQYVRNKDYWAAANGQAAAMVADCKASDTREVLETLLFNQFEYFYNEQEMQKIILWQISERSRVMFEVCEERERLGAAFFEKADPYFEGTEVDLRAIAGLLVAGLYYMVLHAKANDSLFCQIDINSVEGRRRIKDAVSHILKDAYMRAGRQHA